jgi:Transposase domain (DUF772)
VTQQFAALQRRPAFFCQCIAAAVDVSKRSLPVAEALAACRETRNLGEARRDPSPARGSRSALTERFRSCQSLSRFSRACRDVGCAVWSALSAEMPNARPISSVVLFTLVSIAGEDSANEVQVNLAYRWFCKLGIEDSIPDPPVFCRAWHERFRESDALRRVFEGVVAKCIAAGLVGGRGIFIDACLDQGSRGQEEAGAWRSVDCLAEGRGGIPCARPIARKERWPLRQHRQHRLRPYWAPAGVGASQVDSCRRKRDMPDLRAVVLGRLRIHYR